MIHPNPAVNLMQPFPAVIVGLVPTTHAHGLAGKVTALPGHHLSRGDHGSSEQVRR